MGLIIPPCFYSYMAQAYSHKNYINDSTIYFCVLIITFIVTVYLSHLLHIFLLKADIASITMHL